MINFTLIRALIQGDWFIDESFALNAMPLVDRILSGQLQPDGNEDPGEPIMAARPGAASGGNNTTSANKVMIIPVQGPLMKSDGRCGEPGMARMGSWVREANRNPEVAGVVLSIDSPGGTVDGTENFARIIKNSGKPVVAYVDGMAASAALWIASSAREIMASSDNDQLGSVGAMLRIVDSQPAMEKEGYKFHTIVSAQTPDKNKRFLEVLGGNYEGYQKEFLNPIAQVFIDAVKSSRPGIKDSRLTGKMFFARELMGELVDKIGSLDDAVNRVFELSSETSTQKSITEMRQFDRINAVLGVEALEAVEEVVALNEDQLTALESALEPSHPDSELQEQLETAQQELEDARASLTQAQNDLQAANDRAAELQEQLDELANLPGAPGAVVVKQTDGGSTPSYEGLTQDDIKLFNSIRS